MQMCIVSLEKKLTLIIPKYEICHYPRPIPHLLLTQQETKTIKTQYL